MAYIIGLLTVDEEVELRCRGWELEDAPTQLIPDDMPIDERRLMRMVWVDADMFAIMSGPDWDRGRREMNDRLRFWGLVDTRPLPSAIEELDVIVGRNQNRETGDGSFDAESWARARDLVTAARRFLMRRGRDDHQAS